MFTASNLVNSIKPKPSLLFQSKFPTFVKPNRKTEVVIILVVQVLALHCESSRVRNRYLDDVPNFDYSVGAPVSFPELQDDLVVLPSYKKVNKNRFSDVNDDLLSSSTNEKDSDYSDLVRDAEGIIPNNKPLSSSENVASTNQDAYQTVMQNSPYLGSADSKKMITYEDALFRKHKTMVPNSDALLPGRYIKTKTSINGLTLSNEHMNRKAFQDRDDWSHDDYKNMIPTDLGQEKVTKESFHDTEGMSLSNERNVNLDEAWLPSNHQNQFHNKNLWSPGNTNYDTDPTERASVLHCFICDSRSTNQSRAQDCNVERGDLAPCGPGFDMCLQYCDASVGQTIRMCGRSHRKRNDVNCHTLRDKMSTLGELLDLGSNFKFICHRCVPDGR